MATVLRGVPPPGVDESELQVIVGAIYIDDAPWAVLFISCNCSVNTCIAH